MCDGIANCTDGADEKECGKKDFLLVSMYMWWIVNLLGVIGADAYMNHSCIPDHGCLNKGNKKCMPISRACDGYAHTQIVTIGLMKKDSAVSTLIRV